MLADMLIKTKRGGNHCPCSASGKTLSSNVRVLVVKAAQALLVALASLDVVANTTRDLIEVVAEYDL